MTSPPAWSDQHHLEFIARHRGDRRFAGVGVADVKRHRAGAVAAHGPKQTENVTTAHRELVLQHRARFTLGEQPLRPPLDTRTFDPLIRHRKRHRQTHGTTAVSGDDGRFIVQRQSTAGAS